jgi:hypothetical protein
MPIDLEVYTHTANKEQIENNVNRAKSSGLPLRETLNMSSHTDRISAPPTAQLRGAGVDSSSIEKLDTIETLDPDIQGVIERN